MTKRILYHYTKFESALKIIESENVRFSVASKTNDPFEFGFIGSEEDRSRILKHTGMFCLSASKNNILMLSHYAEKHSGCMIEFEFDKSKKGADVLDLDLSEPDLSSGAMGYSYKVPNAKLFFEKIDSEIDKLMGLGCDKKETSQIIDKKLRDEGEKDKVINSIVGTKRKEWSYESELRLLWTETIKNKFETDGCGEKYKFLKFKECGLALKKVHYGCKSSAIDREILRKISDSKGIEVKAAIKPDFREYA